MASASSDRVDIARAEIAGYAKLNRAVMIQPYTFDRWAKDCSSSESYVVTELKDYASRSRSVRVQPYTFERWAKDL